MKKGYEYDDNTYNETEGGHPQIICFSKEDAMKRVKELNTKEYKEVSILDYSCEEDCLNVEWDKFETFNKSLVEKYGEIKSKYSWDNTENRLHPSANEEEIEKYCSMVDVSFYEVLETEIDLQSFRSEQINSII